MTCLTLQEHDDDDDDDDDDDRADYSAILAIGETGSCQAEAVLSRL